MRSQQAVLLLLIYIFILIDVSNSQNISSISNTTTSSTKKAPLTNPHYPRDHIVNPHRFSFILNPGYSVCNNSKPSVYILVYVHSGPSNYQRRIVIRETWATQTLFPDLRLVFMIGKILDANIMKAIAYEHEIYQDIVQEDFLDSYRNLTYKGVMALKWISIYCSKIKYILKVDDDIVVNTFTLINHLKFLDKHTPNRRNTILCLLWRGMDVVRDKESKWYVDEKEYPLTTFSPYCSGSAYILSGDLAAKMYNASLYIPFFWIDDYFITGPVASAANVTYIPLDAMYQFSDEIAQARFMSLKSFYTIMFGHFPGSLDVVQDIWRWILKLHTHRFPNRVRSYSFSWDETIHRNEKFA